MGHLENGSMNQKWNAASGAELNPRDPARRILVLSASVSTLCGVLYFVGLMGKWIVNGSIHAASSPGISMLSAAVGLLWDCTLVILFVALRHQITGGRAVFADLGLVFMALLAAISGVNWYVQLTVIPRVAQSGDAALLALLDIHNTASLMYAMEHLAWGLFYGLAAIFMALAIQGGKIETCIRWLLIAGGGLSILYLPGILIPNQVLIDLGYYAAGVLLPITTMLLVVRYWSESSGELTTAAHASLYIEK
jgi:hypothetical protein